MPFALKLEPGSGVIVGTCSGQLSVTDARKGAVTFWANPEWVGRPVVWDFRAAQFDVHAPEIRDVARFFKVFRDFDEAMAWAMGRGSIERERA